MNANDHEDSLAELQRGLFFAIKPLRKIEMQIIHRNFYKIWLKFRFFALQLQKAFKFNLPRENCKILKRTRHMAETFLGTYAEERNVS